MNFAQAFDDAGAIVTLIGMIPVAFLILIMSMNMDNPNYDMMVAFERGMYGIVEAVMPALGITLVIAIGIWIIANSSNGGR